MAKRARTPGLGRLESFSDAVFAIALTLLVLDLLPKGAQSPQQLLDAWPTYLAYLAGFITIGITWLNHNQHLARLRGADPVVLVLNLGLLLGVSLAPWPTALVATALTDGDRDSQIAAILVYSIVTVILSVPWLILDIHLMRHPALLESAGDVKWMRTHALASIGTIIAAGIGFEISYISPLASLILFLVIGAGFLVLRLREKAAPPEASDDVPTSSS